MDTTLSEPFVLLTVLLLVKLVIDIHRCNEVLLPPRPCLSPEGVDSADLSSVVLVR